MKLKLIKKLGDGAFADVWRAHDELDRDLAVKVIRPANVGVADALAHAKALARATHPNVVAVHGLESISDPETGDPVECIVMELLEGVTLSERLATMKLTFLEARTIGSGIINGLRHIHAQGMTHGDLHEENVMVVGDAAKVIDILYLNSLAVLTTERRETKLKRDLLSLRLLLQLIIKESELDPAEATEFNNLIEVDATILDIDAAFQQITAPSNLQSNARHIEHLFARITEEGFVEGEEYAEALADETPATSILPVLKRLVIERAYETKHKYYVQILWPRLPEEHRIELLHTLGAVIEEETPKGKYWPALRLLSALEEDGWNGLPLRVRIRLEGLIVKDVLAGHKDIHSAKAVSGGALGTYARPLWRRFKKPEVLADNLISLLRQNWYTQNYVGEYFLNKIPAIARVTKQRGEFIKAIKIAVSNDARLIIKNIDNLPDDWVEEIEG